jgi:predicted transcriptional regulator
MSKWTFITNHGIVFLIISRHNRITAKEISDEIGITERTVLRIIGDLEKTGYIERKKEGRCNAYTIQTDRGLRHEVTQQASVAELLNVLNFGFD